MRLGGGVFAFAHRRAIAALSGKAAPGGRSRPLDHGCCPTISKIPHKHALPTSSQISGVYAVSPPAPLCDPPPRPRRLGATEGPARGGVVRPPSPCAAGGDVSTLLML